MRTSHDFCEIVRYFCENMIKTAKIQPGKVMYSVTPQKDFSNGEKENKQKRAKERRQRMKKQMREKSRKEKEIVKIVKWGNGVENRKKIPKRTMQIFSINRDTIIKIM